MGGNWIRGRAALLAVLAAASCSQNAGVSSTPELSVSGLNGTPQATASELHAAVTPSGNGFNVTLDPGTATLGRELYVGLDYDASSLHAAGLQTQSSDTTLALAVEPTPGHIELGLVSTSSAPLSASNLLTFSLQPGAARRTASLADNAVETRARNLSLQQNTDGNWELSWDYTNPGDADQNSQVAIADLSALGANFDKVLGNNWDDPLRNVDCDHNGVIGISDLTPIGAFYSNDVYSYKIEMSQDGQSGWITVGELLLEDQDATPSQAVRFTYTFGAQYVSGYWYRVQPQTHDLQLGAPSEAVCETGRLNDGDITAGDSRHIVASVQGLEHPLRMMNGCRVVYPYSFTYVPGSFSVGSVGGERADPDGLWGTFATQILFPPDSFLVERDLGNGTKCVDFNVTVSASTLDNSPAGYGDLFNFELRNDGSGSDLTLTTQDQTEDGIKRTYYSDKDGNEYLFGNSLVLSIK